MVPGALQQITVQKRAVVGGRGMRRGHAMLRRPEGATVDEVASQRLDARFGLQPSGGDQMLYRSSLDSPLEEGGFELSVPPDRCGGTRYDLGRPFYGPVGISSSEPRRFCAVASEPPA